MMMSRKLLSLALMIVLALPLNAWSAAGMALAMGESAAPVSSHHEATSHDASPGAMHHHAGMAGQVHTQDAAATDQTQNSDDCDEHCMNCVSHCFGSGIVSAFFSVLNVGYHFPQTTAGLPLERAFLLYRPPIQPSALVG